MTAYELPPNVITHVVNSIDKIVSFVGALSNLHILSSIQKTNFRNILNELTAIESKLKLKRIPCISYLDLETFQKLGDQLANDRINGYFYSATIQQRLGILWSLCKEVTKVADPSQIMLWRDNQETNSKITSTESVSRLESVLNTTATITETILRESERDILTISSILLTIILRTEASEYELGKIIQFAKRYVPTNTSPEELISVESSVSKGEQWKSDIRAIRDAVSHARFEIISVDEDIIINFDNKEEGYNFVKRMRKAEILHFYQDFHRMTIFQTKLLSIMLLIAFINKYLKA